MAPPAAKRIAHLVGSGLAMASLVFLADRLRQAGNGVDLRQLGQPLWFLLLGLAVLYGMANRLLAQAWFLILRSLRAEIGAGLAVRVYARSQIGKYVPGNIFQFAGRQVLGVAAGVPGGTLLRSTGLELGLIIAAGAAAALLLPAYLGLASVGPRVALALSLGGYGLGLGLISWSLGRTLGPQVRQGWLLQSVFLLASGTIFLGLLLALLARGPMAIGLSPWLWPGVVGAFVLAWLLGLITPGAPAGVGVRELVLLALLSPFVPQATILLATVVGRLVTIGGDLLFFGWGCLASPGSPLQSPRLEG
jgi:hypothetical protein